MTPKEILEDSIGYYKTHPRSILRALLPSSTRDRICLYMHGDSRCVAGRFMTEEACAAGDKNECDSGIQNIIDIWKDNHNGTLDGFWNRDNLPQSVELWEKLQEFHDTDEFWVNNDQGGHDLTPRGKKHVELILRRFKS